MTFFPWKFSHSGISESFLYAPDFESKVL